jgi:cytochrome c-type biogenesis protein CcmE
MKAKHQRLGLIGAAMVALIGSGLLAMSALKDQAAYFYAPSDIAKARPAPGQSIRLGGMVLDKSIKRAADGVTIDFVVTDNAVTTPVRFRGIVPDLFKENSGVIAEGKLGADGVFVADTILAKHDERYMPPQMDGKMHKTGAVK